MNYKNGRPKGYAPWKPNKKTQIVFNQIIEILNQYRPYWPLVIRQIFYRLVGNYRLNKTEKAYARVCEYTNRGRRSGIIPWEAIRDDGTTRVNPEGFTDANNFLDVVIDAAETYVRDKEKRQPKRILILVEAAGMVPQIVKVVGDYGIPVISSSGFDSLTMKYELAQDIINDGRPTVVLHIGDLDPSGVCIFDSVQADVKAFVGDEHELQFIRIALTPEQVALYDLPTVPPKKYDKRGEGMRKTCQVEALAPDILADIVKEAVMKYYDMAQYKNDVTAEKRERKYLMNKLSELEI